jgi:hypothetical protein
MTAQHGEAATKREKADLTTKDTNHALSNVEGSTTKEIM